MVKYTGRGLVVKRPAVLSKVQMLNLVLGVGVFSQERKFSPKRKFWAGHPCGRPAKNFGQALQILEKQAFRNGHPTRTSMKKLRSEKLRADFSFPIFPSSKEKLKQKRAFFFFGTPAGCFWDTQLSSQEPGEGVLAKGVSAYSSVTHKKTKNPAVHLALRAPQPREAYMFAKKPFKKKPFLGS